MNPVTTRSRVVNYGMKNGGMANGGVGVCAPSSMSINGLYWSESSKWIESFKRFRGFHGGLVSIASIV